MVRDYSQKTVQELYETIRVNVDEEEQWKVFDFVEDFFMEELEIGDYINDINSYHLHMFDKHDVTTKKFDAIVEKAGKVDANYAAQIEGYCSLLGEYGKKFEAVCAMLQPEKLRLSPDKYREKLDGINTGYQNAKDTHEQEQSAYEAELYEIETVWYKKMLDKAEDYLIRSAECVVLGNFTDEVTVLGVGVQIVLGIFDLDLPCDIRDIIADIKNLAETDRVRWDLIGMLALDLIGLIPVIGALKYSDEVGTLFKNAGKVSVVAEGADGVGAVTRHADEAGAWLQGVKVFRYSDETAEAVASGEKLLKESQTVYESFADMMSPDDAAKYLDFLENGSKEGLTSAELAGVEKADVLLVSQKVKYEDVWDLRNAGDALESGSKTDVTTGLGYDAGDTPVRIDGDWTENDMKQALLGHPPRGLGSPDIHHGGQMPGGALHEVLPGQHRNNPALHPNTYNQGVTPEMRMEDRQLHWWYRAREQGADELLPDWIYD